MRGDLKAIIDVDFHNRLAMELSMRTYLSVCLLSGAPKEDAKEGMEAVFNICKSDMIKAYDKSMDLDVFDIQEKADMINYLHAYSEETRIKALAMIDEMYP